MTPEEALKLVQTMHDNACALGAKCDMEAEVEVETETPEPGKSVDLIAIGGEIKSLSAAGEVGGYLVRWGSPQEKDLEGDYFTKNTYFGSQDGAGADVFMNHCIPLGKGLEEFADWMGKPIKTSRDTIGLFAKTVLDLADEYEKIIFDLVAQGKLKWSSGTASHLVKRAKDGQIKRWVIADASLTPIPAEWRGSNKVYPIKSYQDMFEAWSVEGLVNLAKATDSSAREIPDDLRREAEMLKALAGAS